VHGKELQTLKPGNVWWDKDILVAGSWRLSFSYYRYTYVLLHHCPNCRGCGGVEGLDYCPTCETYAPEGMKIAYRLLLMGNP
jgi:hypothetical protein